MQFRKKGVLSGVLKQTVLAVHIYVHIYIYIYIYIYTFTCIYGNLPLLRKREFRVRIFRDKSSAIRISVDGKCVSRKICTPVFHVAKGMQENYLHWGLLKLIQGTKLLGLNGILLTASGSRDLAAMRPYQTRIARFATRCKRVGLLARRCGSAGTIAYNTHVQDEVLWSSRKTTRHRAPRRCS